MRTDRELLADYAATASEAAFAELAGRHGGMVYRTCLRSLGNEADAEDAAQAVFLVLVRKRRALRSEGELGAWLHRVAKNVAHLAARSRVRRARHEEEAAMATPRGEGRGARGESEKSEALALLDAELDRLPADQRQAVVLRYLEGRPQEEAARLMGCPQGTLARRAQIGLERLRERLCQRGKILSAAALVGLLGAEAGSAAPAALLSSILAASKLAAVGAAAGASGGTVTMLAEGVVKMMFWAKVKVAAVAAAAAFVAVGVVGAGLRPAPTAAEPAGPKTEAPAPPTGPSSVKEEWGKESNGLVAGLRAKKAQFAAGEAMEFEVVVSNLTDKAVTVPGGADAPRWELSFTKRLSDAERRALPADMGGTVRCLWVCQKRSNQPAEMRNLEIPARKAGAVALWAGDAGKEGYAGFRFAAPGGKWSWFDRMEPGEYEVRASHQVTGREPWEGKLETNAVIIRIGSSAPEAVDGLKLTISADKLEVKAGDEVEFEVTFENVSKEDFRILRYWGQIGWELVAPDGGSLASAPTAMPGLAPPIEKNFPELKAGGKLSWKEKTLSGNPPSIYVGPGINPRNVYLVKPGTYKLTAVYSLQDGTGKGVAPGKVWAGTVRSNTLELKLGGEFKAPAQPGKWPAAGIPGVTFAKD